MADPARRRVRDPRGKVMGLDRLAVALRAARRAGRRVVFTNGVFDLLHPGHVRLLHRARSLGDLLVVAINTDASVRRLKGPGRPFLSAAERALMVAALEAVDYVVTFSGPTPLRVIRRVRPDVLVKGADWKTSAIVGKEFVRSRGGRVRRVRTLRRFSTTRLARRILASWRS